MVYGTNTSKWLSKDILSLMIKSEIHNRTGNLVSNFSQILPPLESDLVQQSFKDPIDLIFDYYWTI